VIRIGVLGCARIAPPAVIGPARRIRDASIVAVASRDGARATRWAKRHHVPRAYGSYERMLSDPDVDAVYIPLPNSLHAEWTLKAIEAGKHVLCEKPLASSEPEALRLAAAARSSGLVCMEAFHYRYHPLARRIEAIVAEGELGELRRVEVQLSLPVVLPRDIRWDPDLDGGAAMDVGCYAVNAARWLLDGEPVVRTAAGVLTGRGVDRSFEATLQFPRAEAVLRGSILGPPMSRLRVEGTRGSLDCFNPILPQLMYRLRVTVGGATRTERVAKGTTYAYQLASFVAAVRDGAPFPTTFEDSVKTMRVLDQVRGIIGVRGSATEERRVTRRAS